MLPKILIAATLLIIGSFFFVSGFLGHKGEILPSKIFGQTSVTIPFQTKPISSTSPQVTPTTKPVGPNLVDENYAMSL